MRGEIMYSFNEQGRFVIEDYNQSRTFSSFLPGIAGVDGIPMWVFYVNRGQAIASFGVENKDSAILEFHPAHKSYQLVTTSGFRTFLKIQRSDGAVHLEPFSFGGQGDDVAERLEVGPNSVELHYINRSQAVSVRVKYFTLPNENFAALVREVTAKNEGVETIDLEMLDGLPAILPYGIPNGPYKELGNTLKAWMGVFNLEHSIPFYKVRGSIADTAEVQQIHGGHFFVSYGVAGGQARLLDPIVDSDIVFGHNTSFSRPDIFHRISLAELQKQEPVTTNKVPAAFSGLSGSLAPNEEVQVCSMFGHTRDIAEINGRVDELVDPSYLEAKEAAAERLTAELTDTIATRTSKPLFDAYCRQSYLDNVLRGGQPIIFPGDRVYHVYSRKHGDLERDYNFFSIEPSFYSQGNGNFRDINQNRRSDVFFNPDVQDSNLQMFVSLIQTDGYNPLVVKGLNFTLSDDSRIEVIQYVAEPDQAKVRDFLAEPFTPGRLLHFLNDEGIALSGDTASFLTEVMQRATPHYQADPGEGYWVDHWTYNMDLIDSYLAVYPDKQRELLFGERKYLFYDNPHVVLPRSAKHVLVDGKVRQYGAVVIDKAKQRLLAERQGDAYWSRTHHGKGELYKTNLHAKLVILALTKFATLDPAGMGVEMEANKPGWNDSLNGLPGLFGSSMPETFELQRLLQFLISLRVEHAIQLPEEVTQLLAQVSEALRLYNQAADDHKEHAYWDRVAAAREQYREAAKYGFSGVETEMSPEELQHFLEQSLAKLAAGVQRAEAFGDGLCPTYFYFTAEDYEERTNDDGSPKRNHQGLATVRVKQFRPHMVPHYLEGPTRAMKVATKEDAVRLYQAVRRSELYDEKLRMYKVGSSLENQPFELGRATAFTPGWLEHASVFTHMEYKYMLEVLRSGLHEQFYQDALHVLMPFLDPNTYGRSTLEHSSFIASSANPDPSVHGRGFVARLSGATAEFLHMWTVMFAGARPFQVVDGTLALSLNPALPHWLFDDQGRVEFAFLGRCRVTYENPDRQNTYGEDGVGVRGYLLVAEDGEEVRIDAAAIVGEYAERIREGRVQRLTAYLGR